MGLLPTKLHPRQARPHTLARPRLIEQLERCAALPLTVVLGPAGAGKSTAVVGWLAQTELPVAWLSLDPADDAPNRLLAYLLAALQTVEEQLVGDPSALLAAPEPDDLEALWADTIVIPLARRQAPLVLVLDDFHVIADPRLHAALAWLLDHGPACLRLLLLSRSEPPLPLARARARGELGEIGVDDLRFSFAEARRFYAEVMGLQLDDQAVEQLELRTEGWPAGAQLAGLSLRAKHDGGTLPSGSDRLIADYLLAEVFESLPEPIGEFLLATAPLERLCAPLAAAVTDDQRARERLAEIERANLFLIPLDAHGRWFRYHHLFRDFLRERARARGSTWLAAVHRRAALWLADRNLRADAFEHAVGSGDEALITELFERWAAETLMWHHTGAVRAWLARVPGPLREREAAFWFMDGWCDVIVGQLDAGLAKLDRADQALARGHASPHVQPLILSLGPVLRVAALLRTGRFDEATSLAVAARASLEPEAGLAQALPFGSLLMHEALVDLERGQLDDAEAKLERAEQLIRPNKGLDVLTLAHLAELHRRKGRPDEAERCARRALQYADESSTAGLSPAGLARVELAHLALDRGDAEAALVELEQGLDRIKLLRDVAYLARGTELWARAKASVGEREDALERVDDALVLLEGTDMRPALARMMALRAELVGGGVRESAPAIEREPEPPGKLPPIEPLTTREAEVLTLVATGLSNHEIARRLHVSVGTVKTHVHRILNKLGVSNRTRAVHRARLAGLLTPSS
ncbi:MAG TPA: LuxR C-terminal-related transcriptional regulator [Enhygromyxa sp.]|nr:LuxR C-terminal-related transcriptional regulator [Enhygromyxa sp.]